MVQDFDVDQGLMECIAMRILDPLGDLADRYEEEASMMIEDNDDSDGGNADNNDDDNDNDGDDDDVR